MAIQKGDILRATHGVLNNQPIVYVYVKNQQVLDKLKDLPDVIKTGSDPNGDLWVVIPKTISLKDFVKKADEPQLPLAASFMEKIEARYRIQAKGDGVRYLMQSLYQMLGNKRYLHDLEKLFQDKLADITPQENETLMFLMRDLKDQHGTSQRNRRESQWKF
jgi:hypothetical protein